MQAQFCGQLCPQPLQKGAQGSTDLCSPLRVRGLGAPARSGCSVLRGPGSCLQLLRSMLPSRGACYSDRLLVKYWGGGLVWGVFVFVFFFNSMQQFKAVFLG